MSTVHSPEATSPSDRSGEAVRIRTALFSTYDRTGVVDLASAITRAGGVLIASAGTARALADSGLDVLPIEEYAGLGEGYGGRVKTLHPKIHAGILARRDVPSDLEELAASDARPIDLVCVNLYPFEAAVAAGASESERIEKIDIGGPAMIRAAAKNWRHVAVVCDPADIPDIVSELETEDGALSSATRRRLAVRAFARTAAYDDAIHRDFAGESTAEAPVPASLPDRLGFTLRKVQDLRYGENPHQAAALYGPATGGVPGELPGGWRKLAGTELSYNNWIDLAAAAELAFAFDETAAVIVKHTNPCGAAIGGGQTEAWKRALASDPVSAFGGIAAFNRPLEGGTAEEMKSLFLEVVVAPGFTEEARRALAKKKRLRLVESSADALRGHAREWKVVPGGVVLVQETPGRPEAGEGWTVVSTRAPSARERTDLEFAWKVVAHMKSNAIVFARDGQILGVGAGQMSRVDSVRIAVEKARELGHDLAGSVLASDAFFPFADGPQRALDAGAVAIVQPGGSKRDAETITAVNEAKAAMIFTGRRVFRH